MAQRTLKQQKEQKQGDLLNSAYQCFLTKGFAKTTIDDIVRRAQVAKGTFYLYFHDKEDIMKHLVIQISSQIVIRVYTKTKERNIPDFLPAVLCFIDTIIEYFKANKAVLKLIERNFSWPLVMEYLSEGNQEEITQILEELLNYPQLRRFDRDEAFRMIYMIVELVGSVCYTSIIEEQPAPIDHLKPTLYRMVEKILI